MRARTKPLATIVHWTGFALVAALAGALLLGPAVEGARKITVRFATVVPATFPYYDGMLKFKEILEKKLPGRVEVKLYHSGKLGDEREIEEGVLQGSVHFAIGAGAFAGFAPIMDLVELPFLIKNQAHMERIATGPIGRKLAELVAKQSDFRVLAWYSTGDSSIETTKRPVRRPEDLRGAKIRTMPNKAMVAALKALGANPTPVPYLEVYTSLKQGVVEGTTNDWMSVKTMKFYESLKYATDPSNAYLAEPRPVVVSKRWYGSLPRDVQRAVAEAVQESAVYQRQVFLKKQTQAIEEMKRQGMVFTDIDVDAFIKVLEPVWYSYAKGLDEKGKTGTAARELVKEILASRP